MRICIDFNGVLADSTGALCELLRRDTGIIVPNRTFEKKLIGSLFPNIVEGDGPKILTKVAYEAAKNRLFDTIEFLEMKPVEGALHAVLRLQQSGFEIVIVTDAKTVSDSRIHAWFRKHGFPSLNVVFTRKGRKSKQPYQRACDVVVDNDVRQLIPLLLYDAPPRLVHFLPPNGSSGCDIAPSIFEACIPSLRGWFEVLDYVLSDEKKVAA